MISSSRAGARERPDRRWRSAVVHSGMFSSGNSGDGLDKQLPRGALCREHAPAFRGQLVEPPAALAGLLHPGAENPAALFEAVQQGIERSDMELQLAVRPGFDQF